MKGILKFPLIVAAVVVVLRIIVERTGGSPAIANALSIAALHTVIAPIYFAIRLATAGAGRPYGSLFRLILIFAVVTRAMLIPVYWLGRIYQWPENRFNGLFGPNIGPLEGFVIVPFATAAIWIVSSIVVGGAIGAAILAILGRSKAAA